MASLPSNLSLTNIADGASIVASDHRNNYSDIQAEQNALLTILAAGTAGQFFTGNGTTVSFAYPPGYEFGYAEFTSAFTTSVTTEATAAAVVTAPAITFDGSTKVIVEFFAVGANVNAAPRSALFALYDGSSSVGIIGEVDSPTSGYGGIAYCRRVFTPAAATKTYSIRAYVSGGAGTCQIAAGTGGVGNNMPGYIRITKA